MCLPLLTRIGRLPRSATSDNNFPRTSTLRQTVTRAPDSRLSGFGGFPTPFQIAKGLIQQLAPKASLSLGKTFTMPRTNTLTGRGTMSADGAEGKEVPYISFSAIVGRNSRFTDLTDEQKDELGGVEYRALRILLYVVIGVSFVRIVWAEHPVFRFRSSGSFHHYIALYRGRRKI